MNRKPLSMICLALAMLASAGARADMIVLVSPEDESMERFAALHKRLAEHPNAVDRADAYCDERPVGDACTIPGAAFDGGGSGVCVRRVNVVDERIDKTCAPRLAPVIDRGLPAAPWRIDSSLCPGGEAADHRNVCAALDNLGPQRRCESGGSLMPAELQRRGWQCDAPAEVADRFCAATPAGGHCVAEGTLDGQPARFEGVCTRHVESSADERLGVILTRPVLTCESAHPSPHELKSYSAWRKLFQ